LKLHRREFLAAVAGAAAWPALATAEEPDRVHRLGVLIPATRASIEAFFDELRVAGFVEGHNLVVAGYYSVPVEQNAEQIADLVEAAPEAILCGPETYARALRAATQTIPLDSMSEDLVGEGLAASLANPGGNVTGISLLSPELDGKRQEILTEAVPGIKRMAALAQLATSTGRHLDELQRLARSRGVELSVFPFAGLGDVGPALDAAKAGGAEAVNFLAGSYQIFGRDVILAQMARIALPAIYQWPETSELGGLIGYGPLFADVYRQRARQIAKIFRGAKATDVPIEQPANFALAINVRTAKAIGHVVPPELLVRADKVIE
jgi:putative tryptophan/tyrosine transport system substrate-binding protein